MAKSNEKWTWDDEGPIPDGIDNSAINRNWFPEDFIFGTATSSYQVEGAYNADGKGLSIWDDFTLRTPDKIDNGTNGVVACNMYNRYKEDIRRMKQMGFNSYRFSLSWPRILPGGRASAGINKKAIDYYNDIIDTVIQYEMVPNVTIFHWDTPLTLEREYGGFMSEKIKDDFLEYAEICFYEFGDRVRMWATLNEPLTYTLHGYVVGIFPPGKKLPEVKHSRLSSYRRHHVPEEQIVSKPDTADDGVADPKDAYTVARNLILCHGVAAQLYNTKFKDAQGGKIGIVLNGNWVEPLNENSKADKTVASRAMDFMIGWFLEPALYGRYPQSMVDNVKPSNLKHFNQEEQKMLTDSIDFLGFNYYTAQYAAYEYLEGDGYTYDQKAKFDHIRHGENIGPQSPGCDWLYSYPPGIYKWLKRINDLYKDDLKEVYITENGCADKYDFKLPAKQCLKDDYRQKYYQDHLANVLKVMKDTKLNVKGYYAWSWCDNFEWNAGYSSRFGLVYIDYMNNQTRYPKDSCAWFTEFLRTKKPSTVVFPWAVLKLATKRANDGKGLYSSNKRSKLVENHDDDDDDDLAMVTA